MIWNPWKEIAKLREEIATKDAVLEMRLADWERTDDLSVKLQKDLDAANKQLYVARKNEEWDIEHIRRIVAEEKPTSNATVKRICGIAQEVLDMHQELEENRARMALGQ